MKAGGWHQNGGDISQVSHRFSARRQPNPTVGLGHQRQRESNEAPLEEATEAHPFG
jgi:hypothetical protein